MAEYFLRLAFTAPAPQRRSALLERLLARADERGELGAWRETAFAALSPAAPMPPIAPVALLEAGLRAHWARVVGDHWVWLATPVHLEPGLDNVRLSADGVLRLAIDEAQALATDFNRVWSEAPVRLEALGEELFLFARTPWPARTFDPNRFVGEHIDEYLPQGTGAAPLKALMSEIEMWLFEHAVNRDRGRRGLPQLKGLWLWGGGARIEQLPATQFAALGEDALFRAFANQQREARVVVACEPPGTRGWENLETEWLGPCAASLTGDARLTIARGSRAFGVSRRWRRRIFRSSKAWWEYFE